MTDVLVDTDWRIEWREHSWTSADLTGEHVSVVAELLDIAPSWEWFNLNALHPGFGPLQMMSIVAAFLIVEDGVQGAKARQRVLSSVTEATVDELLNALTV